MRSLIARLLVPALTLLALPAPARAEYPERPLTIVEGFPAGGMVDILARPLVDAPAPRAGDGR